MSDRHIVRKQKVREKKGSEGEYGRWCQAHPNWHKKGRLGDRFDVVKEDPRANPDSLREDEGMYANASPSTPQLLIGEAVDHLQGRQREVYILVMREGKSLAEAAEVLGIEKGSAQKYKERAIKFISAWCKNAMARGRV